MSKRLLISCVAGAFLLLGANQAQADSLVWADFDELSPSESNDCPNFFGDGGFSTCDIGNPDPHNTTISPVIIKYNYNKDEGELQEDDHGNFDSIDGDEFTFTDETWTYSPGAGDPAVNYWVIKQGNDFRLYWVVADLSASTCEADPDGRENFDNFTCLTSAIPQTSGTLKNSDGGFALSHVTFYDGGSDPGCNGDCEPPVVPEPASLLLLGSGLAGVATMARRRRKNNAA